MLAEKAHVAPSVVYYMMVKRPIEREEAIAVLGVMSTLTGQHYTLDNVQVVLYPPLPPELAMLVEEDQALTQQKDPTDGHL